MARSSNLDDFTSEDASLSKTNAWMTVILATKQQIKEETKLLDRSFAV
jgi:hypothetical protein